MDSASTIRDALAQVSRLRASAAADAALGCAVTAVKSLQSQRFRGSYADMFADPVYTPAARFFLEELYGARDHSARDSQFERIAGTLTAVFPEAVVRTAVRLAQLHALTEQLNFAVASGWCEEEGCSPALRYVLAWRHAGGAGLRQHQLKQVLELGADLARLTRTPGLRMMLRMMRRPADAAGLGALQQFLEAGFDTFSELARVKGAVDHFLDEVHAREARLLMVLFEAPVVTSETLVARLLGQAP